LFFSLKNRYFLLNRTIWEVRSFLPSRRIARLLFCVHDGQIFIVHGFIKKTQKTPQDEIDLAQKRMKEITT
jgi:phage-related protein